MKNNTAVIALLIAIVSGTAGFFIGKLQQPKGLVGRGGNFQVMQNGKVQRGQGFRPVNGEIIKADEKSITVKLPDGSSKIVLVGEATAINKSAEGSKADLTVGQNVAVFGTENSDGSVTAQNIQLNPMMRGIFAAPTGTN